MKDAYNEKYLPSVVRVGQIITVLSLIIFFVPFLISWFVYGVTPQWGGNQQRLYRMGCAERPVVGIAADFLFSDFRRSRHSDL